MKILACHNYYQQPGGEDEVFDAEQWLLRSHGHDVVCYTQHNDALKKLSRTATIRKTIWNRQTYDDLQRLIRRERPDVMHCTNIFPLISPSAYDAANDAGVPVVQSLHNYRILCPKAQFVREGSVCEKCLGKRISWPSIVHGCYRNSRAASSAVATMLAIHWARGTWQQRVAKYITLTEFSRRKFIAGGLPESRIEVKPNFVRNDPAAGMGCGDYAIYVGRLSPEKGIDTLLTAWRQLGGQVPLRIVGDGPMREAVRGGADRDPVITWLGRKSHDEVLELIGDARMLVFPSDCYETFGLSIVEAFAKGTPVVAANHGAMGEIVEHGKTGLHFEAGNSVDLAEKLRQLWDDSESLAAMREKARITFETRFTAQQNYDLLMSIYEGVCGMPGVVDEPALA